MFYDNDNATWYRQNYPAQQDVHQVDPRCMEVLAVLDTGIHNLVDRTLPGGGIEKWADGISLLIRRELSTFDFGGMTALVVAAHRHLCRVTVEPVDLWGRDRWLEGCEPKVVDGIRRIDADAWTGWADIVEAKDRYNDFGDLIPDDRRQLTGYMRIVVRPRIHRTGDPEDRFDVHPDLAELAAKCGAPRTIPSITEVSFDSVAGWNACRAAAAAALEGVHGGLSWIACDVGAVSDPTVIAAGGGIPGINGASLLITIPGPADLVADVYREVRAAVAPNTEVFDKTGLGLSLWQLIQRRSR